MVSILVDDKYLDLFSDTQVSVNKSNKITADGASSVTYSDNVEVPLTDSNAEIFQINKSDRTIGKRFATGVIKNEGENMLAVTFEVQSVEFSCLEEKISLLVMDAVSGILKDLGDKKLDILFDEEENFAYTSGATIHRANTPLYSYAYVNTNGYNENINPSKDTVVTSAFRPDDDATCDVVFNVNRCIEAIFRNYGIKYSDIFDNDLAVHIPFKKYNYHRDNNMFGRFRSNFMSLTMPIEKLNNEPITDKDAQVIDIISRYKAGFEQFNTPQNVFNGYIRETNLGEGYSYYVNAGLKRMYQSTLNDGEYFIVPSYNNLIGCRLGVSGKDSQSNIIPCNYTDIEEAYLDVRIFRDNSEIANEFRVGILKLSADGVVVDFIPTNDYLYSEPLKMKAGESVCIHPSISFSGNGLISNKDKVIHVEVVNGIPYNNLNYYLWLYRNNDTPFIDIRLNRVNDKITREEANKMNIMYRYSHMMMQPVNKKQIEAISELDAEEEGSNTSDFLQNTIDLKYSLSVADMTAAELVNSIAKRFNKKLSIIDGALIDVDLQDGVVDFIDEIDSSIVLTPKDFDDEVRSFKVKNKDFSTTYDKFYDKSGAFDSKEYIINEDNKNDSVVNLDSSVIPNELTKGSYVIDDKDAEIVNKYGMLASGVPQKISAKYNDYGFRFGYLSGRVLNINTSIGGSCMMINSNGDLSFADQNLYIPDCSYTYMKTPIINDSRDADLSVDITLWNNTEGTGDASYIIRDARLLNGCIIINMPNEESNGRAILRLSSVPELGRNTYTRQKKLQIMVVDTKYKTSAPLQQYVDVVYSGYGYDMTISWSGIYPNYNKNENEYRIVIPLFPEERILDEYFGYNIGIKTFPVIANYRDEENCGLGILKRFLPENNSYSLSFNDKTANGKINAFDRYFSNTLSSISGDKNPYIEFEAKVDKNTAKKILSGYKIAIRGSLYNVVEANDINLGETSIVKFKLTK